MFKREVFVIIWPLDPAPFSIWNFSEYVLTPTKFFDHYIIKNCYISFDNNILKNRTFEQAEVVAVRLVPRAVDVVLRCH